jgi:thymidylate synthase
LKVLEVRNVQEALYKGMATLASDGVRNESRAGDVLVAKTPVTTLYEKPTERVLFWADRDANPFFHFMEGLWMLAGRNDVGWISQFSANISQFSDDGETFHGAYGYRWINHFVTDIGPDEDSPEYVPFNQLQQIAEMLKKNPKERRCVLQMWDAESDLGRVGKDVPCNTQIYFKIGTDGRLNMTVLNRSNDIIWGAYGANAVHMSMLQEFMAGWIGVPVGRYWQVSNDWHAYVNVFDKHKSLIERGEFGKFEIDPYQYGRKNQPVVQPFPMVNGPIEAWIGDLLMFMESGPIPGFQDRFFRKVVSPMWNAWFSYKDRDNKNRFTDALRHLESCEASDWKLAATEWLERRKRSAS